MERPMAKGADPFTVGVLSWSAAAAKITITRIAVIIISITMPWPGVTFSPKPVAPRAAYPLI